MSFYEFTDDLLWGWKFFRKQSTNLLCEIIFTHNHVNFCMHKSSLLVDLEGMKQFEQWQLSPTDYFEPDRNRI